MDDKSPMNNLPITNVPFFAQVPGIARLGARALVIAWILMILFLLDQLTYVLLDKWMLDSLDLSSVFWTNFNMGAVLFVIALVLFSLAVIVPAFVHDVSAPVRRKAVSIGLLVGLFFGFLLCRRYFDMLLLLNGEPFNLNDPVFGKDVKFFVFVLPSIWVIVTYAFFLVGAGLLASVMYAALSRSRRDESGQDLSRFGQFLGRIASPWTVTMLIALGVLMGVTVWLARYNFVTRDNYTSSVWQGAEVLDVTGLFSTLNAYWITAVIIVGVTIALVVLLRGLRAGIVNTPGWGGRVRGALKLAVLLVAIDFAFMAAVVLRDITMVKPNEPVIQKDYIQKHIDWTRKGYNLDSVEVVQFVPKDIGDPVPTVEELMGSPTIRNAPLWPGFVNYLEFHVDPQHAERIIQQDGNPMIYGPTLQVFVQQEKYRTYHHFINVDTVRYNVGGEKRMYASAVRETPLMEPNPWLAWWGQRFVLFPQGRGLVMAHVAQKNVAGEPVYASKGIGEDTVITAPELAQDQPRIYYGEGSTLMAVTNIVDDQMASTDYATDSEGKVKRHSYPDDIDAGVLVDSLLKRVVLGWRSDQFWEITFSTLIDSKTRVHYYRPPLTRLERIAPFLYLDTNPYAVTIDGKTGKEVWWIVNALATTDDYPYSKREILGDKSIERTRFLRPFRRVNYLRDAVKATVNAYTGEVRAYKIADEPLINTYAKIYPDMFIDVSDDMSKMPRGVREHLQYPKQMFHIQFDDVYIYYHMKDYMYWFNQEDVWDDADEVIGPIMGKGKEIVWSVEPLFWLLDTTQPNVPDSAEGTQFVMSLVQTPERSLNLRAMPMVYQDGEDYGRLVSLQVPRTTFFLGPEQADAAIDQEPKISEQISWWNRQGNDVIRGHTLSLVIKGEVIYVEPIFIRSQQNPIPQLKRVIVVYRGIATMGDTVEEALRQALAKARQAAKERQVAAAAVREPGDN
jgi:hypothetical protein